MDNQKIVRAEQILGEPVLPEFSEDLRRTKRNLLIVSSVSIFAYFSGVQLTEANFLGFKFTNPDQVWLQAAVLCIVGYLFIQFIWRGWNYVQLTRLRITGTRVSPVTVGTSASEYGDYPNDPKQSTLYNWWLSEARRIGNLSKTANEVHRVANLLESLARQPGNVEMANINNIMLSAGQINTKISKLSRQIEQVEKTINSARIPVSLERFDRWFSCFSNSHIWQVLILDLIFPFIFGGVAIWLSVERVM